jgi:surface antigen
MRASASSLSRAAGIAAAILLAGAAAVYFAPGFALAGGDGMPATATSSAFSELDEDDEIAALESVQLALTEVADGSSYVWHRRHGRLSGLIHPTASFKDSAGHVCRHVVLILTTAQVTRKAEGIACRLSDGRWQLDG